MPYKIIATQLPRFKNRTGAYRYIQSHLKRWMKNAYRSERGALSTDKKRFAEIQKNLDHLFECGIEIGDNQPVSYQDLDQIYQALISIQGTEELAENLDRDIFWRQVEGSPWACLADDKLVEVLALMEPIPIRKRRTCLLALSMMEDETDKLISCAKLYLSELGPLESPLEFFKFAINHRDEVLGRQPGLWTQTDSSIELLFSCFNNNLELALSLNFKRIEKQLLDYDLDPSRLSTLSTEDLEWISKTSPGFLRDINLSQASRMVVSKIQLLQTLLKRRGTIELDLVLSATMSSYWKVQALNVIPIAEKAEGATPEKVKRTVEAVIHFVQNLDDDVLGYDRLTQLVAIDLEVLNQRLDQLEQLRQNQKIPAPITLKLIQDLDRFSQDEQGAIISLLEKYLCGVPKKLFETAFIELVKRPSLAEKEDFLIELKRFMDLTPAQEDIWFHYPNILSQVIHDPFYHGFKSQWERLLTSIQSLNRQRHSILMLLEELPEFDAVGDWTVAYEFEKRLAVAYSTLKRARSKQKTWALQNAMQQEQVPIRLRLQQQQEAIEAHAPDIRTLARRGRREINVHNKKRDKDTYKALTVLEAHIMLEDCLSYKDFQRQLASLQEVYPEKYQVALITLGRGFNKAQCKRYIWPRLEHNDRVVFPLIEHEFSARALLRRFWQFILNINSKAEQDNLKAGFLGALADGDDLCYPGRFQRLVLAILQGRLEGVKVDQVALEDLGPEDILVHYLMECMAVSSINEVLAQVPFTSNPAELFHLKQKIQQQLNDFLKDRNDDPLFQSRFIAAFIKHNQLADDFFRIEPGLASDAPGG